MTTVAALLRQSGAPGLDRLDRQLLLAHHLGQARAWLIAHDDDDVPEAVATAYRRDCAERASGVPLAYLVGEREFHGLRLHVTRDVLVPRPDTELLVDWALELLAGPLAAVAAPEVADLGTGSGAIALAVKHGCPRVRMLALDLSAAALAVARSNAQRLGLDICLAQGSWLDGLVNARLHLLLSNPPYIEAADPHLPSLHAEPVMALSSGSDGLAALRQIAAQAPRCLHPGGWLLLEHGRTQADAVGALLHRAGFAEIRTRTDLAGLPRCTGGRIGPLVTSAAV